MIIGFLSQNILRQSLITKIFSFAEDSFAKASRLKAQISIATQKSSFGKFRITLNLLKRYKGRFFNQFPLSLWPSKNSTIVLTRGLSEKCIKGTGLAPIAEQRLQNFPSNPLQTDQFIVESVTQKRERKDSKDKSTKIKTPQKTCGGFDFCFLN